MNLNLVNLIGREVTVCPPPPLPRSRADRVTREKGGPGCCNTGGRRHSDDRSNARRMAAFSSLATGLQVESPKVPKSLPWNAGVMVGLPAAGEDRTHLCDPRIDQDDDQRSADRRSWLGSRRIGAAVSLTACSRGVAPFNERKGRRHLSGWSRPFG